MAGPVALTTPSTLPRLAVITDGDVKHDSRGAGRTLVNLLERWPVDRLLIATTASGQPSLDEHGHRVIQVGGWLPGGMASRLSPLVGDAQTLWAQWRPLPGRAELLAFAPELVLVVPSTAPALVWGERMARALGRPVVTYLMDEWMNEPKWLGGNAIDSTRALLRASAGWLAISPSLAERLPNMARLQRPLQVVHNPVTLDSTPPAALAAPRTGPYRIAYAGSVWPMHADAIRLVAESVARLRARGLDMRLVLHTDDYFWSTGAAEWTALGVEWGGLVPYRDLRTKLGEYDLLLVASSFAPEHAALSRSSLQTKVTDYLSVGRPILACGPAFAASNRYLRDHRCAWLLESTTPAVADDVLHRCMEHRVEGQTMAAAGYALVAAEHEATAVTSRLYEFLTAAAARS